MRIEPAILDRDEGVRQIGRHVLEQDVVSGHFAARRQHAAVRSDNLNGRRTFWNFERLDWRQMRADIDQQADDSDNRPQCEYGAPIKQPRETRACTLLRSPSTLTRRPARAFSIRSGCFARAGSPVRRLVVSNRNAVERIDAQLRKRSCEPAEYRLFAPATLFLSPRHTQQRSRRPCPARQCADFEVRMFLQATVDANSEIERDPSGRALRRGYLKVNATLGLEPPTQVEQAASCHPRDVRSPTGWSGQNEGQTHCKAEFARRCLPTANYFAALPLASRWTSARLIAVCRVGAVIRAPSRSVT